MNNPIISLEGVEKRFGSNLVVKKMNLEIAEGSFSDTFRAIGMRKDNNTAYDRRF